MTEQKHKFKAEVQQILDLVVHSLYSKKEIFLRELISNASDAIERAQFEALTDPSITGGDAEWKIRIVVDRDARTLTVSDNGTGMTAGEIESNIGTIASSGTRRFLEAMKKEGKQAGPELIGQFGVGFYSAFMAADRVTVLTRKAGGDKGVKWSSDGGATYSLEDAEKPARGTDVTLHLREDASEFMEPWRIREIVKRYSDYIATPILLDTGAKDDAGAGPINSMKSIWRKARDKVNDEEHAEFYRHITHDTGKPLRVIHYAAEGATEFRALVYIPEKAPFDLFMPARRSGLHLYVRNVLITPECRELLPEYLRFAAGVVDSSDLPLNVSREMLQDNATIRRIRKSLVGKVLSELNDMKEKDRASYAKFYAAFGAVLKEGIPSDPDNTGKLADLLLFHSTFALDSASVSLREYAGRMKPGQKAIYYMPADSVESAAGSPHMEIFRKCGFEVLFMTDPVDEWVTMHLDEYDGKPLAAVNRGDVELGEEDADEKKKREEERDGAAGEFRALLDFMRAELQDDVQAVRVSERLTDSAACLVGDGNAPDPRLERIMRAMNRDMPPVKRILEVNPKHQLLSAMKARFDADPKDLSLKDYTRMLYDQALLVEGTPPKDPSAFAKRIASLMADAMAAGGKSI